MVLCIFLSAVVDFRLNVLRNLWDINISSDRRFSCCAIAIYIIIIISLCLHYASTGIC